MSAQLEGRNPVIEALSRGTRRVHRVLLDSRAKPDPRIERLLNLAQTNGVRVERVDRRRLDDLARGRVHQGVVATADELPSWTTRAVLDRCYDQGQNPFLVLADELSYEHNLGAILRSCLGFGAHALIVPTRRGTGLTPVAMRVSMGACEVVPVVRESLFAALKHIRKDGIPVVGADMGGEALHEVNLTGPVALVMGAEGRGLSSKLREKCNRVVSVPLSGSLESLNVSVAAAVLMYEKARQDRLA